MVTIIEETIGLEPLTKLSKDLKHAAVILNPQEARYMVDAYYQVQDYRIRFSNQIRALSESGEPNDLTRWMFKQVEGLEKEVAKALDKYSAAQPVGQWARSIVGIGPVIAAGLLAHIDITKCPTAGHIWSFAGQNPNQEWGKGQKRPWNADLKRLCYLIGESFVKVQSNDRDVYGKLYVLRKQQEQERNEAGAFAAQAAGILSSKKLGKDTDAFKAYAQGNLPPAHIHARAKRFAVKVFLAHLHYVWYEIEYSIPPPLPYAIEHLGHAHTIQVPHWPLEN